MNATAGRSPLRSGDTAQGSVLVMAALVLQEVGASLAVLVFPVAGPIGMVALRLCLSALLLLVLIRPRWRGLTATAWRAAAGYGLSLAAMNTFFYLALDRLPLGIAVTIEVLGPLTLSVIAGRSLLALLWAAIALAGVGALGTGAATDLDPLGVLFVLGAATMWATFIVMTRRADHSFDGLSGIGIGTVIGGLAVLPLAIATTGTTLFRPEILAIGFSIAILSSAAPYVLELLALRRLPTQTFSILLSLAPAIAAAAGFFVLGQQLSLLACVGIALVITANIGALRTAASPHQRVASTPLQATGHTRGMRILVVDDDRAVRDSLRRSLEFNGYTVDFASDGAEALARVPQANPDAIIMDVMMPRLNGLEATRALRSAGNDVPILVLTARDTVGNRVDGLDAGADDYLTKPFALEELLARLRALLRRSARTEDPEIDEPLLSFGDLSLDPVTREVRRGDRQISLTRTEFALLELFLRRPKRVLERSFILEEVWGFDFPTTANSLEVYVGYVRRKLEADNEPRLLHTVRGVGYVLRETPP